MAKPLLLLKSFYIANLLTSLALGLPLSVKKLRAQVQNIIDKVASSLPGWMAELMNRTGWAVHAQFVMTAKVIYTAIVVDLPLWAVKAIEEILRGFLWKGRKEAKGGHCLVAWAKGARRTWSLWHSETELGFESEVAMVAAHWAWKVLESIPNTSLQGGAMHNF
jgi:hypothetical protein